MPDGGLFRGVDASSSAMGAESLRMTVAAENLAHAGDTRKLANGLPYARQRVHFQTVLDQRGNSTGAVDAQVVQSPRYTQRYDPSHPDADPATGMVKEPDVDPVLELTDLLVASKAFETSANAARGLLHMHEAALRLSDQ
jgi:flagellar basal-body rod protein FlgC